MVEYKSMTNIWPLHTSSSRQVGEMRHVCQESPHTTENGGLEKCDAFQGEDLDLAPEVAAFELGLEGLGEF